MSMCQKFTLSTTSVKPNRLNLLGFHLLLNELCFFQPKTSMFVLAFERPEATLQTTIGMFAYL